MDFNLTKYAYLTPQKYYTSSGYIAFINQDKSATLVVLNSNLTQIDSPKTAVNYSSFAKKFTVQVADSVTTFKSSFSA